MISEDHGKFLNAEKQRGRAAEDLIWIGYVTL